MKEQFFTYISSLLSDHPAIEYEWKKNNREIVFKKKTDSGFDITVSYEKQYITLETDRGYHDHFEAFEKFDEIIKYVMGIVRDLLSRDMRIKEILSNGKPRKWQLQSKQNGEWVTEASSGLIFWNYFRKRTEKNFSNNTLEPREL